MSPRERATRLLAAFAGCDLETVRAVCARDVVVYGTDAGERWTDRDVLVAALDGMRELGLAAAWRAEPLAGPDWVAGVARFTMRDGGPVDVRVTMVFAGERLAHAHFSTEVVTPA